MDPKLLKAVSATMPKFNETIASGFHQREFEQIHKRYEYLLRMTFEPIEKKGVWFVGVRSVRPHEMYNVIAKNTQQKTFETNKESLYPVKLVFKYGMDKNTAREMDPVYVLLPFCDRYGDVWIRGSQYSLQIVLADRGLSVTKDDQIFVRLLGYKFKVGTEQYEYAQIHNEINPVRETNLPINLPANRFYVASEARRPNPTKTPTPLLAWYVFAEYGFSETMRKFGECDYAIGDRDAIIQQYSEDKGWKLFGSKGLAIGKSITPYVNCGLAIAAKPLNEKRRGEIPNVAQQYIAALLYLCDVGGEFIDLDKLDDKYFWRMMVGHASIKAGGNLTHLEKQMADHFDSMNEGLDQTSIQRFAEQRIVVKDRYELFNYIIANRAEIVKTSDKANMLHKEISSSEFTLDKLITAANRFKHDVKNTTELNYERVKSFMSSHFKLRDIESAAWESNMIQEATPTDCPIADYGFGVMSQAKVFGPRNNGRNSDFNPNDPANCIHGSVPFVMSFQRVTKPDPNACGFLAPCVYLINDKYLGLRPEDVELYEATVSRLTKSEVKIK